MNTRERLLETAERLYGERGINGVSLREIVRESGQRNASAAHYHFGSREGLIAAIFERRMSLLDNRRQVLIDQLEKEGQQNNLPRLIEIVLLPLLEMIRESDGKTHYLHFITEMFLSQDVLIDEFVDGKYNHGMRRVYLHVKETLSELPDKVLTQRFLLSLHAAAFSMADIDGARSRRLAKGREFDLDRAVNNLVDMWVGSLSAPMSAKTAGRHEEAA